MRNLYLFIVLLSCSIPCFAQTDEIWNKQTEAKIAKFSPDGNWLLTQSQNGDTLYIREIPTMEVQYKIIDTLHDISHAVFSPDGKLLATGARNGLVNIRDIAKQEILYTFKEAIVENFSSSVINTLEFSSDGLHVSAGSFNKPHPAFTMWVWNVKSGSLLWKKFRGGSNSYLQYINNTDFLYSYESYDGKILDAKTGEIVRNAGQDYQRIYAPNGKYFAEYTGSNNSRTISIFNASNDSLISFLPLYAFQVNTIVFSPQGDFLIISILNKQGDNFYIEIWDIKSQTKVYTYFYPITGVSQISISPDLKYMALASYSRIALYKGNFTTTSIETYSENLFSLSATPNPASAQSLITFTLLKESAVKLSVFDAAGSEVLKLFSGQGSSGENRFQWNTENLPQGIYFIRLEADGKSAQAQCAVVR